MSLNVTDDDKSIVMYTSSKTGTVYEVGDVNQPIPRNKTFAYEEPSQILFQHALSLFKNDTCLTKNRYVVCSGMPLRQFFKQDGSINQDNVKSKMQNMARSFDIFASDNDLAMRKNNSIQLLVQPEALAALRTYLFRYNDAGQIVQNEEYVNKVIAVIDPGGKTTDIAVFVNGKIDMERSITADIGYNNLINKATSYIYDLGFPSPTDQQARRLISTGKVTIRGVDEDHSDWVKQARTALANDIFGKVTDTLSDAFDIDLMLFIGGTVKALENEFEPLISGYYGSSENASGVTYHIPDDADLLNAKGLELFAELWYQKAQ
jgi:hypothetical protein